MKLLIALTLMPIVAFAEDRKPAALAGEHVQSAKALHGQQRYREAVGELVSAYALDPQPQLLFALGQLHVQLGSCERAKAFYMRFLASKPRRGQAALATEAIDSCKPASPPDEPPKLVAVETPAPAMLPRAPEPTRETPHRALTAGDYVMGGVVAAGVLSVVVSVVAHGGASSDGGRTTAAAFGIGGVVAIAGGAFGFVVSRRF